MFLKKDIFHKVWYFSQLSSTVLGVWQTKPHKSLEMIQIFKKKKSEKKEFWRQVTEILQPCETRRL